MDAATRFFAGFYRDPDPRLAADALEQVLTFPAPTQARALELLARAARLSDAVRAEYGALAERQPVLAQAVAQVLAAEAPDPAQVALNQPGDLDLLWGEFLVTGSDAPVRRIASVLAREDRIRAALAGWSAERVFLPWSKAARARSAAALAARGLGTDRAADLDLVLWKRMSGGFQVRAELPFPLTDELVAHLATKGAACWSMQSNAQQHPIVRAVYDELPHPERFPSFV